MNLEKLVEESVLGLDWDLIRHVCLKTKCNWYSIDPTGNSIDKGKVDRIALEAMKQDLRKIIKYAYKNDKNGQMYIGPWMIEWETNSDNYGKHPCNALTVQFIISAITVCDNDEMDIKAEIAINESTLRQQLKEAIESEDYEKAGNLRDLLIKMSIS